MSERDEGPDIEKLRKAAALLPVKERLEKFTDLVTTAIANA